MIKSFKVLWNSPVYPSPKMPKMGKLENYNFTKEEISNRKSLDLIQAAARKQKGGI